MSNKSIICSDESVRAILREVNPKTQTRRIVKPGYDKERQRYARMSLFNSIGLVNGAWYGLAFDGVPFINDPIKQPRYAPGDILYVKETYVLTNYGDPIYRANFRDRNGDYWSSIAADPDGVKWRNPMYLPREAARIFLRIMSVRVERLGDISDEDAIAEGCEGVPCEHHNTISGGCSDCMNTGWAEPPQIEYMWLWDKLNAKRDGGAYSWEKNPWVWVYSFERCAKPAE